MPLPAHSMLVSVLCAGALAGVTSIYAENVPAAEAGLPTEGQPGQGAVAGAELATRRQRGECAQRQIAAAHMDKSDGKYQRSDAAIEPYCAKTFTKDPESYLEQAVPARASAPGAPGIGLPPLRVDGPGLRRLAREGSTTLTVRCAPNAPCSFYCPAMLVFDNELPAITVRANAEGLAAVTVTAPAGVSGDAQILIASPEAEGQACVSFLIGDQP
jgi:hypothetical protein